jgi:hypothetical protein
VHIPGNRSLGAAHGPFEKVWLVIHLSGRFVGFVVVLRTEIRDHQIPFQ